MSTQTAKPKGLRSLTASVEARKRMAIILETLTGVRTTQEAADALGVALARYYQLEVYGLEGLLAALEPRARGRKVSLEQECEGLREELARLEREVKRQQALYRTLQRALGVPSAPSEAVPKKKAKGVKSAATRRRRKQTRGERVLATLASMPESDQPTSDLAGAES